MSTGAVHINSDLLDELREVMEDEFGVLISTYLTDSVDKINWIKESIESKDTDSLRKAAHSFKGSSGNIGAVILADLCKQLEDIGKEGKLTGAEDLLEQLSHEFEEVKSELEQLI